MSLDRTLQRVWYQRSPLPLFLMLLPLSVVFAIAAALRRFAYRTGLLRSVRIGRPVIVIGNVSVGGTGKTPLVIWVTQFLQARGMRVAIVTRGYGGGAREWPQDVTSRSSSREVGDEAVLLASRTGALVIAGPDRVAAARRAVGEGAQVIVSDDGLQHYRLARDFELAVVDAQRGLGNGWLLPAGPLREPRKRLHEVDLVVRTHRAPAKDRASNEHEIDARHELASAVCIVSGERRPLEAFRGKRIHAVAGIGNPEAFFAMLRACGLDVDARALPDHASLTPEDISFPDEAPILMTEKDAVKCRDIASLRHWAVRLEVCFNEADAATLERALMRVAGRTSIATDTQPVNS